MAEVLFEYKKTPSYGYFGMPGGDAVTIYCDGSVIYRNYIFGKDEPCAEENVAFMPELAAELEHVLVKYKETLKIIPSKLNNGTLDGSHDCFQFGKKKISSWMIKRCDIEEVKQRNPRYYEVYKENMVVENIVLDIYNEMVHIINKYDLGLELKKK